MGRQKSGWKTGAKLLTKIVFEIMLAVEMERRHEMSRHPVPSRQALAVTRKKSSSPAV
jgi:hypothetical protein